MKTPLTLIVVIIIPALFAGCRARTLSDYEFAAAEVFGRQIICEKAERTECGMTLSKCSDQPNVHYECMTDVAIIDVKK